MGKENRKPAAPTGEPEDNPITSSKRTIKPTWKLLEASDAKHKRNAPRQISKSPSKKQKLAVHQDQDEDEDTDASSSIEEDTTSEEDLGSSDGESEFVNRRGRGGTGHAPGRGGQGGRGTGGRGGTSRGGRGGTGRGGRGGRGRG